MFVQKVNPHNGKLMWAFISKTTRRVLQWFPKKPSKEQRAAAERRVQFFKHEGK